MTFSLGLTDRLDNLRLQRSSTNTSHDEPTFSFYSPTPRVSNSRPVSQSSAIDSRSSLQRRFTTQSVSTLSSLSPIGQQRRSGIMDASSVTSDSMYKKAQLLEKKQAEFEFLRQKRLQFQQEMERLEAMEHHVLQDMKQYHDVGGQHSEPATPPEFQENGFPSVLSRPNRFSASGIMSPPGVINRPSRAGSQVTSPPVERARAYQALTGGGGYSQQSMSHSRHGSDGDEGGDEYAERVPSFGYRGAASLNKNRNSMPVTRRENRQGFSDLASALGGVDTTAFLFGTSEEDPPSTSRSRPTSGILHMSKNNDDFPVLLRSDMTSASMSLSASSEAFENHNQQSNDLHDDGGWPAEFAPQSTRASMPPVPAHSGNYMRSESPTLPGLAVAGVGRNSPPKNDDSITAANRHSMGARMTFTETKRPALLPTPLAPGSSSRVPTKLQTSFSTSSVPTVNSLTNGSNSNGNGAVTPTTSSSNISAEQRFHNHNASLGRIPPGASNNRHSRDLSTILDRLEPESLVSPPNASVLHAQAAAFGPSNGFNYNKTPESLTASAITSPTGGVALNLQSPTSGGATLGALYGFNAMPNFSSSNSQNVQLHALNAAMNGINLNPQSGQSQFPQPGQSQFAQLPNYQQQFTNAFGNFQPFTPGQGSRPQDSQARIIQQRRAQSGEDATRYNNIALENLKGEILGLCKDQHGCRYLQKKLEERKPEHVDMIYAETKDHMPALMTDPFGNYLCQKLLEYSDEDQRTRLINSAAPHMVTIALNQHGTRALQKMIEYVNTPEQVETVIGALSSEVVRMIQDLNGNHVIQKCLNHLSNTDAQFIFDAVGKSCVAVGTHRHGCCVIQRCIDHATGEQKMRLIAQIITAALPLVQDPFGNYVLQYIFDQNESTFSEPLCCAFLGKISMLSRQKFSSNVIEKCLRIAEADTKHKMIQEIINSPEFDKLADDPYANYVVQTAWDYADSPADENTLAEKVRPILARMRHKPYGRRFASRLAERDKKHGITTTPLEMSSSESTFSPGSFSSSHRGSMSQDTSNQSPAGMNNMMNPHYMAQMAQLGFGGGAQMPNIGFNNNQMSNIGYNEAQLANAGYGSGFNPGFGGAQDAPRFNNTMSPMNFYQPQQMQPQQMQQLALQQLQAQQYGQQQQQQGQGFNGNHGRGGQKRNGQGFY